MNNREMELRQAKGRLIEDMKRLLDKADAEHRSLTSQENTDYQRMDAEVDRLNRELGGITEDNGRRAKLQREMSELDKIVNPLPHGARSASDRNADDGGFSCVGEYMYAIMAQRRDGRPDERLFALADKEKREMQMSTGASGGYAVPEVFSSSFLAVPSQAGIVRRFATNLPVVEGSPDAAEHIPSLDHTPGTGGTYGGIQITHGGEGVSLAETDAKIREITLEPRQVNCYLPVTNKLLMNWQTSNQVISRLLRDAVEGQLDYDMLRGDGVNKALGVINSAAAIPYARAGAGAISFADIYNMVSRLKMGGSPIWIASQTTIPQLAAMVDAGNHAVWIGGGNLSQGASAPMPSTLFGMPLYFSDRLPSLGNKGDLILADFSYYLVKPGSGPRVDISTEFLFTSDKSVFRIIMMLDGRPWLTEPLALEGDSSQTISPFVVLN